MSHPRYLVLLIAAGILLAHSPARCFPERAKVGDVFARFCQILERAGLKLRLIPVA